MNNYYYQIDSPIGPLHLAATSKALTAIHHSFERLKDWNKNDVIFENGLPKLSEFQNEEEIIRALLHEYTHATQDRKKWKENRAKGYAKNPYEIAAMRAEKNWKKVINVN